MMKIKEIIVVEGKHDTACLKQYFDCDTIETGGSAISKAIIEQIKIAQAKRGVIVFTDPDFPGEKIRTRINQAIPGLKNAYIEKKKAKTTKKVGIEHASKEDLLDALNHLFTYQEGKETINRQEFLALGLEGRDNSKALRAKIANKLYLGNPNAKSLLKKLNMLEMNKEDVEKILKEEV